MKSYKYALLLASLGFSALPVFAQDDVCREYEDCVENCARSGDDQEDCVNSECADLDAQCQELSGE